MQLSVRKIQKIRNLCSVSAVACADHGGVLDSGTKSNQSFPGASSADHIDMIEVNSQLRNIIQTGKLQNARQVFDKMPHRDEVTWTNMISAYVKATNFSESLILFSSMWIEPGVKMDPFILSLVLKACGLSRNASYGASLHSYLVKSGFVNSVFVASSLLDMYSKFGKIENGCRVFDEMQDRNVVSWTAIITGLVHSGLYKKAILYFSLMCCSGIRYDSHTLAIMLKAAADLGALNMGKQIHNRAMLDGFDGITFVVNSLATMYNKCRKSDYGIRLFETMTAKDVISWTTIISNFVQLRQEEKALEAFREMCESGVRPNEFTFAAVFSGCAGNGRVEWGEQLHGHVLRLGFVSALSVSNAMTDMYAKCWRLNSAAKVFNGMTKKDIISWSTIISGYCQGGFSKKAFQYLSRMRREGPKPNEFAFASLLSVCGNEAILEQGRQVHGHVLFIGLEKIAVVHSALINMYSKCGSLKEAKSLFVEADYNDVVSWTAMINGYAEHGWSSDAIDLFEKFHRTGLKPDSVTFIGVLTACTHAGLVDLGFYYFNSMREKYRITPSKEHYGCMIDLLCRAGKLAEAENMINTMPFQRDDVVWSTLLRACRLHGDVDRATRAAGKILELDPNCAVTHITLANMYAAKGKWQEAAFIRKEMKSKGLVKEPGWSWIKVKDRVTAFVAGDRSHPEGEGIYSILDLLASREEIGVKELGFVLEGEDEMGLICV